MRDPLKSPPSPPTQAPLRLLRLQRARRGPTEGLYLRLMTLRLLERWQSLSAAPPGSLLQASYRASEMEGAETSPSLPPPCTSSSRSALPPLRCTQQGLNKRLRSKQASGGRRAHLG